MARLDHSHHGLSAREQQIMDLLDAGMSPLAIAERLALKRSYVDQVIACYDFLRVFSTGDRFNQMVRAGTQALARACTASGGCFR